VRRLFAGLGARPGVKAVEAPAVHLMWLARNVRRADRPADVSLMISHIAEIGPCDLSTS
jgi:hypothetical protein